MSHQGLGTLHHPFGPLSFPETNVQTNVQSAEALAEESSEGEGRSSDSDCDESPAALG